MSVSGYKAGEPVDDIFLGNVRDDAQGDAAVADKDKDTRLTKEEMYVADANKLPGGTTLPKFGTWKPGVPREHDVGTIEPAPYGYRISGGDLLNRSEHLGDFHIDGMGFGNARFARTKTSDGKDMSHFVLDCGGLDGGMLLDKDTKINLVIAPRDFAADDDKLKLPDAVILPMNAEVSAPGYSRAGFYPGFKVAAATVDTAKLRELAEGSDKLGFFIEIEAKGQGKRYANLDGKAFQNFVLPTDRIQ